jgi:hypothetical protein
MIMTTNVRVPVNGEALQEAGDEWLRAEARRAKGENV